MRLFRQPLLEADRQARSLGRRWGASGSDEDRDRYVHELMRHGDHVEAARVALHKHGKAYLDAYHTYHKENQSPDQSDEAHKRFDKAQDQLEKTHEDYRREVHNFRQKHGLPHPKNAYWRSNPDFDSYVGPDSFAGKALPKHAGSEEQRSAHSNAVANAVMHYHDGATGMHSYEDSQHVRDAVNHHHPGHDADFDVVENNRDGSPNYVRFVGLRKKQKPGTRASYFNTFAGKVWSHKEDAMTLSRAPLLAENRKDLLPGGLADKSDPSEFDPKQLALGIKTELEHTKSRRLAQEIAMDHLKEDPRYYTKLKKIHKESRTLRILSGLLEQQPVPTDPKIRKKAKGHIGYPPPGMIRMSAYPAGKGKGLQGKGIDAEYPDTPEGRKIAKAHAWQFPSKRTRAGKKTYEV